MFILQSLWIYHSKASMAGIMPTVQLIPKWSMALNPCLESKFSKLIMKVESKRKFEKINF